MYFRCEWKMCRSWERMWRWRMNCTSMAVESCPTSQSVTQSQNLRSSCKLTTGPPSPHTTIIHGRTDLCTFATILIFYLFFFKTQNHFFEGYWLITWGHHVHVYLIFDTCNYICTCMYLYVHLGFICKAIYTRFIGRCTITFSDPLFFIPLRIEYQRTKFNQSIFYILCII